MKPPPVPLLSTEIVFAARDHQTHRRVAVDVPPGCAELRLRLAYGPKYLDADEVRSYVESAIQTQAARMRSAVDLAGGGATGLVDRWVESYTARFLRPGADPAVPPVDLRMMVPNMITFALDDAEGAYRGAGHRHAADQELTVGLEGASPGLVPGPLPAGRWTLTLSAHTLLSAEVRYRVEIGAVSARRSSPFGEGSTASA